MTVYTAPHKTETALSIADLAQGDTVVSDYFRWCTEDFDQVLPLESVTQTPVVPGSVEHDRMLAMFKTIVRWTDSSRIVDSGLRAFRWPGHQTLEENTQLRAHARRIVDRLGCRDVVWDLSFVDDSGRASCTMEFTQRIYL